MANNPNVLRVSFKDNDFEMQLLKDIKEESMIVGDSAWMKLAAYEKIQRDRNARSNIPTPYPTQKQNVPVINSLEDLLK